MVEGALECDVARARARPGRRRPATAAATTAAAGARSAGLLALLALLAGLVDVVAFTGLRGCGAGELGLRLGGLELGGDQSVILGTQVDLLGVAGAARAVGRLLVADELVLALELLDVAHANFELVCDPGVGAALANPGANLVEVWTQ